MPGLIRHIWQRRLYETDADQGEWLERALFDRLMLEHLPALLRFAIRLTGNPGDGEDVLHDSIVRAISASSTLRDAQQARPWLFRIVVNCFRDRLRRRQSPESFDEQDQIVCATELSPLDAASAAELGERIAMAVSTLPPRQREVLVLVVYEGFSPFEAAGVLDMTQQNVRTTLHLAREKLRAKLKRELDEQ